MRCFGPASIVDGVVRLDDAITCNSSEAVEILCRHVLRVFDTEAAVALAVGFHHFAIQIEDGRNALVANGVSANLQARGIGFHHAILHQRNRMHFVGKQAAVIGLIAERLEEVCGGRAERAIRVGLERADAKKWTTKRVPDTNFYLIIDTCNERRGIDARSQFSPLQQLGVNSNVRVFRIHVLHAGDPKRGRMSQGPFDCPQALIMRKWRRDLVDVVHGGVFQRAGGVAVRIVHNDAAGRVRGLGSNACQPEGDGVGQSHVAVVATHKDGPIQADRIDQFLAGHGGGSPFRFVPVATGYPFALGRLLYLFANSTGKFRGAGGVIQLHAVERQAAIDKMHVGVVEAREQ